MTVEVIPGRGSGPDLCQGEVAGLMNKGNPFSSVSSAVSRLPLVAVLLVQAVVGYEWLNSALTKIVRGGFASGLADQLARNSDGAPGWYRSVLGSAIIPHAAAFGYLIQAGELAVGLGLIATALVLLARGQRLSMTALQGVLAVTALMATGGAFMNLNFSLFSGNPPVWSLGGDAFSEGVGIDGILMLVQAAIAAICAALVCGLRRHRPLVAVVRG